MNKFSKKIAANLLNYACNFDVLHNSSHGWHSDCPLHFALSNDLLGDGFGDRLIDPSSLGLVVRDGFGDFLHLERVSLFLNCDHLLGWNLHLVWDSLILGNSLHVVNPFLNWYRDRGWYLDHLANFAGSVDSECFLDLLRAWLLNGNRFQVWLVNRLHRNILEVLVSSG